MDAAFPIDHADQFTGKVEHKFTDKVSLSGVYVYNKTDEPHSVFWDDNLAADPAYADQLQSLRGELDRWMSQQQDARTVFAAPRLLRDPESYGPNAPSGDATRRPAQSPPK